MIIAPSEDYFAYMPRNRLCEIWGCTALSTGFTRIAPGSAYPPVRHPDDHHFVWQRGRTLQAYQFALISEGQGRLEAAPDEAKLHQIQAGDVILLFPGIWHRFAPDPETGWTESWIECTGSAFDRMLEMGLLSPERPVWHAGDAAREIFKYIHNLSREDALGNQSQISTLGLTLLAACCGTGLRPEMDQLKMVERARRILMEESGEPPPLNQLARRLGTSYSTLRRLFREHAGMSLKQYQTEVRIRRACELLRSSDQSVKEIAGHLGYSSAFHFSAQFRKSTGLPPSLWRDRNAVRWLSARR
ncbi:helix-turn-helix transcriptional regulator [Paracoccus albus]|uniref:helix-turn-helix transcriptional regulator n=1 Tax=Paracoccus albus TaxID=3017784 RepID=UPI0022F0186F|nr:AraC family transcriptional regulator [Paracoccus albus]WBU60590.1 AraC family transcriptional regulator [Paracoccus albus]